MGAALVPDYYDAELHMGICSRPARYLRADSATGTTDILLLCQALMIASLCFLKNSESQKLRATPLIVGAGLCCLLYYLSWFAYYMGMVGAIVVLGLTVPPCLAFLLYAVDRKNRIALIPTLLFTAGHLIYAAVNFIHDKLELPR